MMSELKPCPFCGGTAELRTAGGWSGIGCNTDKCPAFLHALMFRTPEEARAVWNRRAADGVPACPESGKHCNWIGGECHTCGITRGALDPKRHATKCKLYENNCGAVHPSNCPDCPFRTAGVEGRVRPEACTADCRWPECTCGVTTGEAPKFSRYRWDTDLDVMVGPAPDGEWVRWADVAPALAEARDIADGVPAARCTAVRCTCSPSQMLTCDRMTDGVPGTFNDQPKEQ